MTSAARANLTYNVDQSTFDTTDRYNAAVTAIQNVTNRYNAYSANGFGNYNIYVYYNSGIPTAQSNYLGSIGLGGTYPNDRVVEHESNHYLGSGTTSNWSNEFGSNGVWLGSNMNALDAQFDGDGSVIRQAGVHFYGYGLNYDTEVYSLNYGNANYNAGVNNIFMRNVALMYAQRQDDGVGSSANPWSATTATLSASDPLGESAFNWYGLWSDRFFAHAGCAYSTGNYIIRTPLATADETSTTPSFTFYGDSLRLNNINGNGGGLQFQGIGTSSVLTINNLILDGGYIGATNGSANLFQLAGNITLASTGTIDAAQGDIKVYSAIGGSGSLNLTATGHTVTLAGRSSFTGALNINGATVVANLSNNSLNPTGSALGNPQVAHNINVNNGSTLQLLAGDMFGGADTTVLSTLVVNTGGTVTNGGNNFTTLGPVQLNGGTLTGTGGAVAGYQMYNLRGTVTVGGTSASTISGAGVYAGYHLAAPTLFNVADVATGTDLTVSGTLINQDATHGSAAGGLTKAGAGAMVLSGSNAYSGTTTVSAGQLAFTTAASSVGPVVVADGGSLRVTPTTSGTTALTATSLTLGSSAGAAVAFDFSGSNPTAALISTGVFTANGPVAVTVQSGGALLTGSYPLVGYTSYAGLGTFPTGPITLGPRSTGTLVNNGTSALLLNVSADRPVWTGADNGNWQTGTTGTNHDWKLQSAATTTDYLQGDNVLFDDTATGSTATAVAINAASVSPAATTFNNATRSYTVSSTGGFGIGGTGGLTKTGAATLTLNTANSYSGGTSAIGGLVVAGNATALGTGGLSLNGASFGNTVSTTVAGRLTTSGANVLGWSSQAGDLTIAGGLSGSGTLRNYVGSSGNYNVYFNGDLSGFTGTLNYTCDANAATGWWRFGTNNSTSDLSNASVVINKGTVTNFATAFSKNFGFADGISGATLKIGNLSGDGVFQASYNNAGPNTLVVGNLNSDSSFSGVIAGGNAGTNLSLTKVGTGKLTLSGTNLYTGGTTIVGGTVVINGDANLGGSAGGLTFNGGTLQTTNTAAMVFSRVFTVGSGGGTLAIAGNGSATTGQGDRLVTNTANALVGNGNLTVTGGGTLAGAAPNTTTAGAGAFVLNAGNSYSGTLTLQSGGMLEYAGSGALGSATVMVGNEGELSSTNGNAVTNAVVVNGGANSVMSFTNAAGTFSGPITLNAAATVGLRNWYNYATVQSGTISGVIAGTGGLTVNSGTGTGGSLNLTGVSTFSGNLTVNSSTLNASSGANAIGRTSGALGNPALATRTVTINAGSAVNLTVGNVLGSGGTAAGAGPAMTFVVNAGGTLSTAAADVGGTGGGDANIFGPVTLNGGSFVSGNGYSPDYQGTILLGTVTAGGTSPSTLSTNASNTTANGFMLGGATSGTNTINFNVANATGNVAADLIASDRLTDSAGSTAAPANKGGLLKTGAGTLLLSAANTYTGGTNISGGTVRADSSATSLGTGPTRVYPTGVLAGAGATGGVALVMGGTITAGTGATAADTVGTLATSGELWSSGSFVAKVSSTSAGAGVGNDTLVVSALTVSAGFNVTLLATNGSAPAFTAANGAVTSTPTAGSYVVLVRDTAATSNVFASQSTLSALGLTFTNNGVGTSGAGQSIVLATMADGSSGYDLIAEAVTATPEPTSLLMLAGVAGPLVLGRRRKVRRAA